MNVDEQKRERKQADLDVEIVDLPDDDEPERRGRNQLRPYATRAQSFVTPLLHSRQRRVRLTLIASILAIIVLVVLASSVPVRNLAVRLVASHVPTPTVPLVAGVDLFYISGAPSWGQAYLDGHVLEHLPRIGVDAPLRLARGQHTLEWRAAPFQTQRCLVSVPPDYGVDTCHYNDSVHISSALSAWSLSFQASLQLLPDNQQQALIQAVQTALDAESSSTTVQPGEQYNAPAQRGVFATAQQPLRATLHFALDSVPLSPLSGPCTANGQNSGQVCVLWGQDCHVFCADPTADSTGGFQKAWDVLGVALPEWDYTTLQGKPIAQNQPDGFGGAEGYELLLPLHITWNGKSWQVAVPLDVANQFPFGNPFCTSAQNEVSIDPSLNGTILQSLPVVWRYASGSVGAAGCVVVAVPTPNPVNVLATPTPLSSSSSIAAYCLQRFGVLLAANDVAHRLWPTMPVADAYEQKLAQQLVISNGLTK